MTYYKHGAFFQEDRSSAFDAIHTPGSATPTSGIYRCTGCTHEVVSEKGKPLPPQNHHQHTNWNVPIRWQLIAATHPV